LKVFRIAIMILVGFSLAYTFSPYAGQNGIGGSSSHGETKLSAGTDPIMLIWGIVGIVLFLVLMNITAKITVAGVPTMKRRAAAFLIDFWFCLSATGPVFALVLLWFEARRTGHFSWHFERSYGVGTDKLIAPLMFLAVALMFAYFIFPLTRGTQTVGCLVMRLKICPPYGDDARFTLREAFRRTGYEFAGLLKTAASRKSDRDGQGRTWWDRETNCSVVLVQYE
jgi:uncharacterized RDD family membrane protein YckC